MVCGVLLAGFSVFYLRTFFTEGLRSQMRWLWAFAFGVLGLSELLLAFWRPLTRRRLLLVELLIFGGTAYYFAAMMHYSVLRNIQPTRRLRVGPSLA